MAIEKVVKKSKLNEQATDFAYWQAQPFDVRLATLEQVRQEYHRRKYGVEPRFQRVLKIIKREPGAVPRDRGIYRRAPLFQTPSLKQSASIPLRP